MAFALSFQPPRIAMPARIILPALFSVMLFVATIFQLVLPRLETMLMTRKREMIQALTQSAWSLLAEMEGRATAGEMTRQEAQAGALALLRRMRYGADLKDYFWINDLQPVMLMHPYRPELEGQPIGELTDPTGQRLFSVFAETVRLRGEGFVDYMWQWKDDPRRIVPKISHVRGFAPWGWVVGTGIYLEDVRAEIAVMTRELTWGCGIISLMALALAGVIIHQGIRSENRRRRAEDLRIKSERKYRLLVESASDFILTITAQGRISFANRAFIEAGGYPEAVLLQMQVNELSDAEGRAELDRYLNERLGGKGKKRPLKGTWRKAAGEPLAVEVTASPLDETGSARGLLLTVRDCTDQRRAEYQERLHQEDLLQAAKSASLGQLVEGVAAEVESLVEEVAVSPVPPPSAGQNGLPTAPRPARDALQAKAARVDRIFKDLREFSRQSRPEMSEILDLNRAVEKAASLTGCLLQRGNVTFSLQLAPNLPRFGGNAQRIEQTLIHLLINAGQAMPATGGPVSVFTRYDSAANRIVVEVHDQGEGMSEETLRRAREPFFTTRRETGAAGLGMTIAERCAKDHGGGMELLSAPAMGTTVRLFFPVGSHWTRNPALPTAGTTPGR